LSSKKTHLWVDYIGKITLLLLWHNGVMECNILLFELL
jgi:hypothetical protein